MVGAIAKSEERADDLASLLCMIANGAMTGEQVMAVNKARQRLLLDK